MNKISISDLQDNLEDHLDSVEEGEVLFITQDNQEVPVAVLVSYDMYKDLEERAWKYDDLRY